jgi:CheY-like chemotaxis protein
MEKPRILIVWNERVIADTLKIILSQYGYECATAYDGDQAIEKAREFRPWILVSDVVMPRMNGVESAIQIKREQPDCEILLYSGQAATAQFLSTAHEQGYDFEIHPAPVHPNDLIPILERLKERRMMAELQLAPGPGVVPKYMVVDDEPVIANTLTHILNLSGFPCVPAYDGDEAIEKARQLRPKFILMGVFMPRMNGVEAAINIVKEQPECRIVLFSGSRHAANLLEGARAKGYEFTIAPKPLPPKDLLELAKAASDPNVTRRE